MRIRAGVRLALHPIVHYLNHQGAQWGAIVISSSTDIIVRVFDINLIGPGMDMYLPSLPLLLCPSERKAIDFKPKPSGFSEKTHIGVNRAYISPSRTSPFPIRLLRRFSLNYPELLRKVPESAFSAVSPLFCLFL